MLGGPLFCPFDQSYSADYGLWTPFKMPRTLDVLCWTSELKLCCPTGAPVSGVLANFLFTKLGNNFLSL